MRFLPAFLLLVAATLPSPLPAQDASAGKSAKAGDPTKLLLGNLHQLGDPEINRMLPELYWALKATEREGSGELPDKSPGGKLPDVMSILQNPSVRHEIEMLDDQYEDLQQRRSEIVRSMNEQILQLLNSREGGNPAELREAIGQIRERAEQATEKAVIPFQFERLKQLQVHILMHRLGAVHVLTNDPLASELELSDTQKDELRTAAREIEEELSREIARLRAQAMQQLFSKLNNSQQAKLSKIMGEEFLYVQAPKKQVKQQDSQKHASRSKAE